MKSLCASLAVLFFTGLLPAVVPTEWNHATEADFSAGQFKSTVATSLGEIALARQVDILVPGGKAPDVVSAVLVAGKTVYFASGVDGAIYKADDPAKPLATVPGAMVCCLVAAGKDLLAGTGGDGAGVYRIDAKGQVAPIWRDPAVKYVWAIVPDGKGGLYAATGPEGKVFAVDAAGKAQAVYQAGKGARNILCLARSRTGLLYAGTDESGLVVEIDPARKAGRILLDAAEKEISSLVVDDSGGLYAASSDVSKASPDGAGQPNGEQKGKAAATAPAAPPPAGKATDGPRAPGPGEDGKPVWRPQMPKAPPASGPASQPNNATIHKEQQAQKEQKTSAVPAAPRRVVVVKSPPPPPSDAKGATPVAVPPPPQGNAVYYIAADGLVRTVFRKPVTILGMERQGDRLILATGNGGDVYAVTLDGDEIVPLVRTDARQVTCLAADADGRILFGTANKGSVGAIDKAPAKEGTFISKVLDAQQIARWGTLRARVSGGKVTVATRSGNVDNPDEGAWSEWSKEQQVADGFLKIASPAGRFLQYRLTLFAAGDVPVVRQVAIIYQVDNIAPIIAGVKVEPHFAGPTGEPKAGPKKYRHITVQAADPNGDALAFDLAYRQLGTENWITFAEKLDKPQYVWDTLTAGDGTYELRVTADDSPANPAGSARQAVRISDPFVIDNAAPTVENLVAKAAGGKVFVSGEAVDAGSRVVSVAYSVDSAEDWSAVLPQDGIADSGREKFAFEIGDLKPGAHRVAVRVVDVLDNVGYGVTTVVVGK